jgi:hypothetical protein
MAIEEFFEPAQDEESLSWLNATRSVWRNTVSDLKTTKSKAPVLSYRNLP